MTLEYPRPPRLSSPLWDLDVNVDVTVIGSGYGGAVAACRLAHAGFNVCVIERGREYLPGDFPSSLAEVTRGTRVSGKHGTLGPPDSLYQLFVGEDGIVGTGCGLGGGSLINSGVVLRPSTEILANHAWPREIRDDHGGLLEEGFRRAERMLGGKTYPTSSPRLHKAEALSEVAASIGATIRHPPIGVYFDRGRNHVGVEVEACNGCGECNSGCNRGAKATLTTTYLADAVAHGARLFTGIACTRLERRGTRWLVCCNVPRVGRDTLDAPPLWISTTSVVLSAGVLGTTEILLRSREAGLSLSTHVGRRISRNGNILSFAYDTGTPRGCRGNASADDSGPPVGPSITTALELTTSNDVHITVEDGAHPHWANSGMRTILACLSAMKSVAALGKGTTNIDDAAQHWRSWLERGPSRALDETMNFLLMVRDDASARMTLENGEIGIRGLDGRALCAEREAREMMERMAKALGGRHIPMPGTMTMQPLGGCVMADCADDGVVDHAGRVFSAQNGTETHPYLYVADGSILPLSLGMNPLLTITALAERTMALFIEEHGTRKAAHFATIPSRTPPSQDALTFTERMAGHLSPHAGDDFARGEELGRQAGISLSLTLTLCIESADEFATNPVHGARLWGTATCAAISLEPMRVTEGRFELSARDPGLPDARRMTYHAQLATIEGRRYWLDGWKLLRDDDAGALEPWRDTTTLNITVHDGPNNDSKVFGRGRLRMTISDFFRQLSTLRAVRASTTKGAVNAHARLIASFAKTMVNTYGGPLSEGIRLSPDHAGAPLRSLHAPLPETHQVSTADGNVIRVIRYRGGDRGPVVLLHGYSTTEAIFNLDTIEVNLVEALCAAGYDTWLPRWRGNRQMTGEDRTFTLDDIARFDHPAAFEVIAAITGKPRAHVVAHCLGSQTLLISLLAGYLRGRVESLVCMQVAAHWESPPILGAKVHTRIPNLLDVLGLRTIPVGARLDEPPVWRWLDAALHLHPISKDERCNNPTCRRAALLFGEMICHRNVNAATHERMCHQLAHAAVRPFIQMAMIARRGEICDARGHTYLADLAPLRLPITFLHSENNRVVGPGTTARTWQLLSKHHGDALYRRIVVPGYGHNDALIGERAHRDVFPLLLQHLSWAESLLPSRGGFR